MEFELLPLDSAHIAAFKNDMQTAFQQGAVDVFAEWEEPVLPMEDIDRSLQAEGAVAYMAMLGGEMVGGAIIVIHPDTQKNSLDFLYVKSGCQSKGVGQQIWHAIETCYPETVIWETCTPYFEKRNIHFYINRCGFHAVEFFCTHHPDPHIPETESSAPDSKYFEGMFRFEKRMR